MTNHRVLTGILILLWAAQAVVIGYSSIRINRRWRICVLWVEGLGPTDVEIVDYH